MNLAGQVKKLRKSLGLTQREFARRIPGQPDPTYIGKIERGDQNPSIKLLRRMATAYGVPLGYFFLEGPPARLEDLDTYLSVVSELREPLQSWLKDQLLETLQAQLEEAVRKAFNRVKSRSK